MVCRGTKAFGDLKKKKSPHSSSYVGQKRTGFHPAMFRSFFEERPGTFFFSPCLPDQSGSQARADWSIQAEGERPAPIDRPCIGCDPCQRQIITHSHSPLPQPLCVKVKAKVRRMQLFFFFFFQPAEGLNNHLLISISGWILQMTVIWLANNQLKALINKCPQSISFPNQCLAEIRSCQTKG